MVVVGFSGVTSSDSCGGGDYLLIIRYKCCNVTGSHILLYKLVDMGNHGSRIHKRR